MTTFEYVRDLATLGIAVFGAGLSLFNYWEAKQKERRKIKVKLSTFMITSGKSLGPAHAKVEAVNIGQRDVTISNIYLEIASGGALTNLDFGTPEVPDSKLPMRLTDGETAHRSYSYSGIGKALIGIGRTSKQKIIPVCVDSSGTIHKGKAWKADPKELASM